MRSEHPPIGDAAWRAREQARRRREWLLQGVLAALLIAVVAGLAFNTAANLEARQIRSGFGFLAGQAGFDVGEALIEYSARDSYLRAFVAGMLNTLRVASGRHRARHRAGHRDRPGASRAASAGGRRRGTCGSSCRATFRC